jgi:hypothetical protein
LWNSADDSKRSQYETCNYSFLIVIHLKLGITFYRVIATWGLFSLTLHTQDILFNGLWFPVDWGQMHQKDNMYVYLFLPFLNVLVHVNLINIIYCPCYWIYQNSGKMLFFSFDHCINISLSFWIIYKDE